MPFAEYLASLGDNPYFGAGAGLVGIGAGLAVSKRLLQVAVLVFRRKCLMSLEVNNKDAAYPWLLQWITARGRSVTQHLSVDTTFDRSESGRVQTEFRLVPSPGDHFMCYRGRWMKVERHREKTVNVHTGLPFESVSLTTYGLDPRFFTSVLSEAQQLAMQELSSGIVVYTAMGPEWRPLGHPRRKRPLSSVVLDQGVSERLASDVHNFIDSSQWYIDRGVPYRRGYLLYGPPGCGKSSFITALSSDLGYSICILSLSERTLTDDRLNHLLSVAPLQSIILLEDIDAAFVSRDDPPMLKGAYDGLTRVTFSGLLNALDGVASSEARLLFMTTNYVERLDPALIRPGRVDLKEYIGYCTDFQLLEMFRRFYPESDEKLASEFVHNLRIADNSEKVSPAAVQGHFLTNKNDAVTAVQSATFCIPVHAV